MCTLFIHRSKNSDWPILIANNRDEYLARTFKSPGYHWNNSIFAGKDILEGGSWLGLNENGLCAAILNRASNKLKDKNLNSRGKIIIDILKKSDAKSALKYIESYFKKDTRFFNLFISDYKNAFWIKYDQNELESFEVPYGFSIIDNYDLNDNKSPKQKLYRDIFLKKKLPNPSINYFKSWQELLFLEDKYDNVNLSSVFVKDKNNNYGTVCSSIIGLPNKKKIKNNMVWLYSEYKSSFNHLL